MTTASAKKGIALLMAKSHVPTTGPARSSAPASVPLEHAVGMLERVRVHQLGHDRLCRGVVHGPPAGVDQHDHDQDRQRHAIAQNEECADRDGECTDDVRDGHEWAAFETVGEGTRRQRKKEPGQAVGCDDAETASGCGSTTTAIRGIAPNISPSPPLARVNPAHSRRKGRPRGFLRMRCLARLRVLTDGAAELGSPKLSAPRMDAGLVPSDFWRDNGGCRLSVKQIR